MPDSVPLVVGARTRFVGERIYPGIILAVTPTSYGDVKVTWRETAGPGKGRIWETGTSQLVPAKGFRRSRSRFRKRPRVFALSWDVSHVPPYRF